MIKKSSRTFFIQRWWRTFSLYRSANVWTDKLDKLVTTRNFPCLSELDIKDDSKDEILITIEIIKKDVLKCRYGPIAGGKYFRRRLKQRGTKNVGNK